MIDCQLEASVCSAIPTRRRPMAEEFAAEDPSSAVSHVGLVRRMECVP